MKKEQVEALHRVKATFAYTNDLDAIAGNFQVEDIKNLLDLLEEREETIRCVKSDIEEISEVIALNENDLGLSDMVNSTLLFLEEAE
jgi:uncharacterized protein related to proFAR isomerase